MPDTNFVNVMLISGNINYFNRIIKKYDTLEEYQALGSYYTTTLNFDPGNNLTTNLIIGSTSVNALTFDCNYLLVYTTTNNITTIQQRWWVMDQKRTRAGQYTLSLKRDVIADFYDIVINSPCFIEKATIRDYSNPLIFNPENMTFNQIKTQENLLQEHANPAFGVPEGYTIDEAWIVGYVARNYAGETFDSIYDVRTDYTDGTLPYVNGVKVAPGVYQSGRNIRLNLYYHTPSDINSNYGYYSKSYIVFDNDSFNDFYTNYQPLEKMKWNTSEKMVYEANGLMSSYLSIVGNEIKNNHSAAQTGFRQLDFNAQHYAYDEEFNQILNLNGKTLHDTNTNKYYRMSVTLSHSMKVIDLRSNTNFGYAIDSAIKKPVQDGLCTLTGNYASTNGYTKMSYDMYSATVSFNEFQPEAMRIKLSSGRNRLNDAPYDMFAIPYSVIKSRPTPGARIVKTYTDYEHFTDFYFSKEDALHVAESIGAKLGANLYDIQILPYGPISNLYKTIEYDPPIDDSVIYLGELTEGKDYDFVKDTAESKEIGIIFWATQSHKTFDIPFHLTVQNPKIENETKLYRLVSPNYSGMFEFSPAKNGGVDYFNVDVTFKPYQPYIHINPNFKFMYGSDFNDSRGLICGGDFSIAIVDDKWANFEINNKNYQMIFDREVQNLDFNRGQERISQVVESIGGTVAAAVQGGMMGGAAGAIAGGVASAAGGVADFAMSEAKYKEQKSLKTDLYNYNLGNIRALPNSLTKSMSLNGNFKFWPFLEVFACSDAEREALELKLLYDGMTVMKIGQIAEYIVESEKTFVKGEIIRLENLPEATDVAYEIYNEIKRGVYI